MVLTTPDKILIEALHKEKGFGAIKIVREFPSRRWSVRTVNYFLKRLEETGSTIRRQGSGRPRSVRVEENVTKVKDMILSQEGKPGSSLSQRETARETNISRSSVQRIAKHELRLKVFKRVHVSELSVAAKQKRQECSERLLRRFSVRTVKDICFSDEKIFTVTTPKNPQNDRVHSTAQTKRDVPKENLLRMHSRSRGSVMVWMGFTMHHKLSPIFVPAGAKVNAQVYQTEILNSALPELRDKEPNFILQQDGAPAHRAHSTLEYLTSSNTRFIEPALWPPNSPDLNPLDYFLWSALEHEVYKGGNIDDVDDLKRRIVVAWDKVPQASLCAAINKWRSRLQNVVEAQGGHIEPFANH